MADEATGASLYAQHRRYLDALPPFTDDPVERLRHTVAVFMPELANVRLVTATSYSGSQGAEWTGLTYGDLQRLQARLDLAAAELAEAVEELNRQRGRHCPCCTRANRTGKEGWLLATGPLPSGRDMPGRTPVLLGPHERITVGNPDRTEVSGIDNLRPRV